MNVPEISSFSHFEYGWAVKDTCIVQCRLRCVFIILRLNYLLVSCLKVRPGSLTLLDTETDIHVLKGLKALKM